MTYEEAYPVINEQIERQRRKWHLKAVVWFDYDDIAQMIRAHVYKKWHLYDQSKPLVPWVARLVHNQIVNLLRDNYFNIISPCKKCACASSDDTCDIYGEMSNACPLYRNWFYNKKNAFDTRMPLPMEHHSMEVDEHLDERFSLEFQIEKIHKMMKIKLSEEEWLIYQDLYINQKETPIDYNSQQYKQVQFYKTKFIRLVKQIIDEKY